MKYTRIYTGSDGLSHFQDVDIPLGEPSGNSQRSEVMKANSVFFRTTGNGYEHSWVNAPRRQFLVVLAGEYEIIAGDGTARRFNPGDVLLAEDLTGKGHVTRALSKEPGRQLFIPLGQ